MTYRNKLPRKLSDVLIYVSILSDIIDKNIQNYMRIAGLAI